MVIDNRDKLSLLFAFTVLGAVLRFVDLGDNPLWIDEAIFAVWSNEYKLIQEYPTIFIAHLFNFQSEYWLRFMFALAGTLTIPAIYLVVKNHKLEAAALVAVFPLFIFWSRMARPYAFAGLFLVLGWRWWYFSIVSIFTTVISFIGVRFHKQKIWIIAVLFVVAAISFANKENTQMNIYAITNYSRLFYLPLLALLLYATEYKLDFTLYKKVTVKVALFTCVLFLSIWFMPASDYGKWYSKDVAYSDWRNAGQFDFATNQFPANWYSGGKALDFKDKFMPLFNKMIVEGRTVRIGLDYRALQDNYKEVLPRDLINKFAPYLERGEIVRLAINKKEIRVY